MTHIVYKTPLFWPQNQSVIQSAQRGYNNGFQVDMKIREAIAFLEDEIKQLAPDKASLHSDIDNINNERLRRKLSSDSAVTLEFTMAKKTYYLSCDKWNMIEHNIYALHLAVRNFRNMVRWGIGSYESLLVSFEAGAMKRPAANQSNGKPSGELPSWMEALGLGPTATLDDANAVYRRRAKDLAENEDALIELNVAIDEARHVLGGRK